MSFAWEGIHRNKHASHRYIARLDGVTNAVRSKARDGYEAARAQHSRFEDTGASRVTYSEGTHTDAFINLEDVATATGDNRFAGVNSINLHTGAIEAALRAMGAL